MDKSSFLSGPDDFVSPYLRRRLRPLAEVLHGEQPGPRTGRIEAGNPQDSGLGSMAAAATGPSENERNRQNCAK